MARSSLSDTPWVVVALIVVAALAIACCVVVARRLTVAQAQRRGTQRLFDLLSDGARDYALWLLGPAGRILQWNSGAERIHGYDAAEMIGRHCSTLYTEQDRSANTPQRVLELAARQGKHVVTGVRVRKDGRQVFVDSVLHALRDDAGRLTGFCEIERDVSERMQLEETLKLTQAALMQAHRLQAIGRLSGGVAHDFNNVVQVIKNCARVLQRRLADQPQLLQFLDMIERNADRAGSLSQHLLGMARLESSASQVTNVHEVIEDAIQLLRHTLSESIVLEHKLGSGLPWTSIDRNQLEATLLNLAANARDAMPGGGTLSIETDNAVLEFSSAQAGGGCARYVTVTVSDSGPGRQQSALRAADSEIIEQAGGRVTIDNLAAAGTIVTLWLPCVRSASAHADAWQGAGNRDEVRDSAANSHAAVNVG